MARALLLAAAAVATPHLTASATVNVTLAWTPSTNADVTGYNLYYGVARRTYTNLVVVATVSTASVTGLVAGTTYYFAATAVNSVGLESDFSNEVACNVPSSPPAVAFTNYYLLPRPATYQDGQALEAVASSPVGITNVAFYDGGTLLGNGATNILPGEYVLNWQSAAVGTHTITAVAWDSYGFTTSVTNLVTVNPGYNSLLGMPMGLSNGQGTYWSYWLCPALGNPATTGTNMTWLDYNWGWWGYGTPAAGTCVPTIQQGVWMGGIPTYDAVLGFKAPTNGTINISGACAVWNGGGGSGAVLYRMLKNSTQLYPTNGWLQVVCPPGGYGPGQCIPFALTTTVAAGDTIYLQQNAGSATGSVWPFLQATAGLGAWLEGLSVVYTNSAPSASLAAAANGTTYAKAGTTTVTAKYAAAPNLTGNFKRLALVSPHQPFVVEASTDLVHWTAISTNLPGATSLIQSMQRDVTQFPCRFYRIRSK